MYSQGQGGVGSVVNYTSQGLKSIRLSGHHQRVTPRLNVNVLLITKDSLKNTRTINKEKKSVSDKFIKRTKATQRRKE